MIRTIFLSFLALTFVSGCATVLDSATQDITVKTPGAHDAFCFVDNGDMVYRIITPGTARISRRPGDLTVRCMADGNREKTVIIDQQAQNISIANVGTAFVGTWVDYETGALFKYPATIIVDFRDMPASAQPLPNYHQHFENNPELAGMEEFRPARSALQSDAYDSLPTLQKRSTIPGAASLPPVTGFTESTGTADRVAIIGNNTESLNQTMNPGVGASARTNPSSANNVSDSLESFMK